MKIVWSLVTCVVGLLFASVSLLAETRAAKEPEEVASVEMFAAIKRGDISVKVIAKDSDGGNVLITNKTDKPLNIVLPEVFAARPVLAQFNPFGGLGPGGGGGGMNGGLGMNGMNGMNGGANQQLGGGFMNGGGQNGMNGGRNNPFGGGMNGMNFGGPAFKVEPEKVRKIKMVTVCLEHGKPNPNTHIEYEIAPLDEVTQNAKTIETVKMLARRQIDQKSAQAAAWNLENGVSWEKLAAKIGVKHITGKIDPYFTANQIALGQKIVAEAERRAKANATQKESESQSLAQTK